MSEEIYFCSALGNTELTFPVVSNKPETMEGPGSNVEKSRNMRGSRNLRGEPIACEEFPTEIYGNEDSENPLPYDKLPSLFKGAGWVVSEPCATVLQQFDLGQGRLCPTKFFRKDRKTLVPGNFYFWNFGNMKMALNIEHSARIRPAPLITPPPFYNPPIMAQNDEVAICREALKGPQVWIDPKLQGALFISGQLADALKEAGLDEPFGMHRCKII